MTGGIRDEIQQRRRLGGPEEEVFLAVQRTAALLLHSAAVALEPYGLTPTQYNVLRVLRGAGPAGLPRAEIGARLLSPMPDVTRLVDRLVAAGLVQRARDAADRRVARARITPSGLALLERLDAPIAELHRRQLGALGDERLRTLAALLDEARAALRAGG